MFIHPHPDPIAIEIFGFGIRWYGLMYLTGLGIAWALGHQLLKRASFSSLRGLVVEDLIVAAAIGVIIGGRLGYVLFYNPAYYASNPLEIFYLWNGGMSFHGGLLGVIVSLWILARLHAIPNIKQILQAESAEGMGVDENDDEEFETTLEDTAVLETVTSHKNIFLRLVDLAAVLTPPGLGLGRLGNFINAELPGRVTSADLPWAMSFGIPDYLPRHPSQLYQMFFEGILLTCIMLYLLRKPRAPGWLAGAFLIIYAMGRFFVEFFREPDTHLGLLFLNFTMGQLLSIPMLLLGLFLIYRVRIDDWRHGNNADGTPVNFKTLLQQLFVSEPSSTWDEHEKAYAENYGDEKDEEESRSFFARLFSFSAKEEEEEVPPGKFRLTRQQKRRLKKKKRKNK